MPDDVALQTLSPDQQRLPGIASFQNPRHPIQPELAFLLLPVVAIRAMILQQRPDLLIKIDHPQRRRSYFRPLHPCQSQQQTQRGAQGEPCGQQAGQAEKVRHCDQAIRSQAGGLSIHKPGVPSLTPHDLTGFGGLI